MKRIKKILLLLIILLVSGCTVNYNLTINPDSSINLTITASENTNTLKVRTNLEEKEAVNYFYNEYKNPDVNSEMNYVSNGDSTTATIRASFSNIEDYIYDYQSDIFDKPIVSSTGDIVKFNFSQMIPLDKSLVNSLIYDSIVVNIKIPFKVISNNADSIDEEYNIYSWNINKDGKLKTIEFEYDKSQLNTKDNDDDFKFGNISLQYHHIVIIGLVIIIVVITLIVAIKNKKNNKV